jgi:thiamine biosynthesis lipoprotein
MTMHDVRFRAMGTRMRVAAEGGIPALEHRVRAARAELEHTDHQLTRFDPESALSQLNADPRETVTAGPLLRDHVRAAVRAAERSGGLVDPTLLGAIERAGYVRSRDGAPRPDLRAALAGAPARRRATADPAAAWRAVEVDDAAGTITRPPGVRLDLGGTAKGRAADRALALLRGARHALVDCGGDLALAGDAGRAHAVRVEHPGTGEAVATLRVAHGGVATSGVTARAWRHEGRWAHHLLDPTTGEPCWSGLLSVTAIAGSALEAEVLAKAAYLRGAAGARRLVRRRGGVLVHEDGDVEVVTPATRPQVRRRTLDRLAASR